MSNGFPGLSGDPLAQALALHRQGQFADAEKLYKRALKANPKHFDALHLLGMLNFQRGKPGEAYALITEALKLNPRSADALSNLGLVLRALKRDAEAMEHFDRAVEIEPNNPGALNNRGTALTQMQRPDEALASLDRLVSIEPRHVEGRINRGNALLALRRYEEALGEYGRAASLNPRHPGAHLGRGHSLFWLNRVEESVRAYEDAVKSAPGQAHSWNSLGVACQGLKRHEDAISAFDRALDAQKDYADALFNSSLSYLSLRDYATGFERYEWRWKRGGMESARRIRGTLWLGEKPLAGKTILLTAEQGLGDTIQFARYIPVLHEMGARVAVEAPAPLVELLSRVPGVESCVARGDALPAFDFYCPFGSLPHALKTTIDTIPAAFPYLSAPPGRIDAWRARIPQGKPIIALAWSGSASHVNDRNRSIAFAQLAPLLSLDNVQFVSVQRDLRPGEAELLAAQPQVLDFGPLLADFSDTAAILSLTDRVISVDTAVAHLAGALGRPLDVMIPFAADWRWLPDGAVTPWYPQARPFRQEAPGAWDGVVGALRTDLAQGAR